MSFPKRTVHLDFHTGPAIPDVGADFDPEEFARTFRDAHVDSVTVFATCHHGHAYWRTDRPERHPSLPADLDLLGEQIRALHAAGIRAPIYLSVQCNEFCADAHPEWIALNPDGSLVRRPPRDFFEPAWRIMDMSSPYQEHLADQIVEVLDRFAPVDGIFLDMCWDQPSVSKWALAGMRAAGLDPTNSRDRAAYAAGVTRRYMERFSAMVAAATNRGSGFGVWFNSRPKVNLNTEKDLVGHVEVEALPTGGWGYSYLPYVARYVRPLGLPSLSHTGRFFKSWGDNMSLKPEAALKYECAQTLSHGLSSGIGDLLHPRGVPNSEVYRLVGRVYDHIRRCEPWVEGASHVSEAALIVDPELGDRPGPAGWGAVRALTQLRLQFDVRDPGADLSPYRLAIVPETTRVDPSFAERLSSFVEAGGAVILSGASAFDADGAGVLPQQGIASAEPSPFRHTFVHATEAVAAGLADFPYVMYEPGYRAYAAENAEVLARLGEPYFERSHEHFSGHDYTPFSHLTDYAAVLRQGSVVTFALPLFEAFGRHGAVNYKRLIGNVIDLLLPDRLVRDDGPSHVEIVVAESPQSKIAHVLSFIPERRAEGMDIIEDPIPLVDVSVSLRCDRKPARATLQPHGTPLEVTYNGGYAALNLTLIDGHGIIVLETDS